MRLHEARPSSLERYDAFLSYAHEDAAAVRWLHRVLERYWILGKRRREIFFDASHLAAGALDDRITTALRESRFLIVCCSEDARESTWVDQEIAAFLSTHSDEQVLACLVGQRREGDERVLPREIEAIERRLGKELFTPDLRGTPATARGASLNAFRLAAIGLLPPLVGLRDKSDVLARVRKARRLAASSIAGALIVASGVAGVRDWWLTTPNGLRHTAVQSLLRVAESQTIDDVRLLDGAVALGASHNFDELRRFARIPSDSELQGLLFGAGFASATPPRCADATRALGAATTQTLRLWPEAALLVHRECGGEWLQRARPDPERMKNDTLMRQQWGERLARTGHTVEAREQLNALEGTRHAINVAVALIAAGDSSVTPESMTFVAWRRESDEEDRAYDVLQLLEKLDSAGRLRSSTAAVLLAEGLAATHVEDVRLYTNWNRAQQLAAIAAGAGRADDARRLIAFDTGFNAKRRNAPHFAAGWAWRGLALHRLGAMEASDSAFAEADRCGRAVIPADRTWREWQDILLANARAARWRVAFAAAEAPLDERVRVIQRSRVIALYGEAYRPRSR